MAPDRGRWRALAVLALVAGSTSQRLIGPPECERALQSEAERLVPTLAPPALVASACNVSIGLAAVTRVAHAATRLARGPLLCAESARPAPRAPDAELGGGGAAGAAAAEEESAGLSEAVRVTARAQTKVASSVSTAVSAKLKTRFMLLIIAFIQLVVIPEYLCPPITDGMMQYMGPTIAYNIITPLVQGLIEAGSPQIPNLLGSVIGLFLALILMMKLIVLLTITLGDGIIYDLSNLLNRVVTRCVVEFVNAHMLTAESFLILHETSAKTAANVANRLSLSLTHSVTHGVTHTVTHRILHHHYCVYCYYYGNYCDFCYYYNELTYMHRLWGFGQGEAEGCATSTEVPSAIDAEAKRLSAPKTGS